MMNDNIVKLVEKLSEEYNKDKDLVMKDVMRKENDLYSDNFLLKHSNISDKDSYFYSAIGRIRQQYRDNTYEFFWGAKL